jgi:hypothetical protein
MLQPQTQLQSSQRKTSSPRRKKARQVPSKTKMTLISSFPVQKALYTMNKLQNAKP